VSGEPDAVLDGVWRREWGRLLALLVAQYRRLELAEDGLADAFEAAARTWPAAGVPANPAAWLLTAARRRVLDRLRAEVVAARRLPVLAVEAELQQQAQRALADDGEPVVDERLRLVLLCASPRLAPEAAAALTLRLVLGLSTEDIARLFLVSTSTMAARLTRARRRLAGEPFAVPPAAELPARLSVVADTAYLAFTAGYAPTSGSEVVRPELAAEAIRLIRLVRALVPPGSSGTDDLDARLALVLLQHARRDARVRDGRLVLLPDQDRSRWHADEAAEALQLLLPQVHAPARPALLEALIAAEHAVARTAADTDWARIAARYAELEALTGSPVVTLNRAVAVAEADGPLAGLALLAPLDLPGHRLPAVRAELLARSGQPDAARAAYTEALARCGNEAERDHLVRRRAALA
jgi:RNA polymerase sigma factor (sigma-70 family)